MTNPSQPDVSIIIVSWNVAQLLQDCLQSVYDTTPNLSLEVIVVDSASSDDTVQVIQSKFPQVMLMAQTDNVGFTRGNNIGLAVAHGRHVFLLNPDTIILGDTIGQMVAYLDENPTVGIVGPHTLNTDMTHQSTRRRFPTIGTAFFESTWLEGIAPRHILDRYYVRDMADDVLGAVDWVQGSALMARHEVYDQIGGLDEGYVMFWEELDWCKRAKLAGWGVTYLGTSKMVHHGGKSTDQAGARKHIHFQESKLRYYKKFHGAGFALLLRIFLLLNYTWQIMVEGIKALLGSKRTMRRERITVYWQVLRSGLKVS
ncbi:MAG: glycosyltransferase family 2 protein [Phototrophicales bacterium]|nr:glycosyltransferase family 2 protein [Phototrophicales bacterium]